MKDSVRQNLKIALFAVLFLVAAVFAILSLSPERSAVEVREKFTVSASRLSGSEDRYVLEVSGKLRNTSSKPIAVERVEVRAAGVAEPIVHDRELLIQPRSEVGVVVWVESDVEASSVTSVSVTVGGESTALRNPAVTDAFGYAFLPLLLALLFLLLLVHAVIVRVYIAQEAAAETAEKNEQI